MTRKYWYKLTIHYCPVCGSEDRYRERQFTPRPADRMKRIEWHDYYDYCLERGSM